MNVARKVLWRRMPTATLASSQATPLLPAKLNAHFQRLTERMVWAILFCASAGFGASHIANILGAGTYYPAAVLAIAFVAFFATPAIIFSVLAFRALDELRQTLLKNG